MEGRRSAFSSVSKCFSSEMDVSMLVFVHSWLAYVGWAFHGHFDSMWARVLHGGFGFGTEEEKSVPPGAWS